MPNDDRAAAPPRNIVQSEFDPNAWAALPEDQAIRQLFDEASAYARLAVSWYETHKRRKARLSIAIRGVSIALGVLAAAAPIVAGIVERDQMLYVTQFGYLLGGIAVGLLAFDRFFGLSSGWMRYMTTLNAIERLRAEFAHDWARMLRERSASDGAVAFLDRAAAFRRAVMDAVESETAAWVSEFRSSIKDLDQALEKSRAAAEARLRELEHDRAARRAGVGERPGPA